MSALRKLAGQTAIYGLSSIVARFVNFLLVPLYTSKFVFEPAEYGVVTSLYAWTALLNVVLTFGMETTYFRFASKDHVHKNPDGGKALYATATYGLLFPALVFLLLGGVFSSNIAAGLGFGAYASSVLMLVAIIGIDAITTIPMARLRQQGRPWRYAAINMISVAVNVGLSVFFILYCMKRYNMGQSNALIDAVYDPSFGVGYVFAINLVATAVKLLVLLPSWPSFKGFNKTLLRAMLVFGAPLMIAGLAGMVNETADRVILKYLLPADIADSEIGIYGACYKLAVLITLFIQAFRMGAEPFFFSHAKEKDSKETFARIMNIFVAVCMTAFLVVMLFLDLFKWFIPNPAYHEGLRVVPILMLANVFLGIYYNQSVWYKLTDRTRVGSTISIIGAVITIVLLFALIPYLGYMGAAWTTLICYTSMAAISYVWGQKHYPIPYNVTRVLLYMAGAVVLWWGAEQLLLEGVARYVLRGGVLVAFVVVIGRVEWPAIRRTSA
ncbi:MAG: oligosaccharide flippase family protein [Flavobacteriales bacterium]|jgi:O-antigen/teichoic acid export membrane protein|nr:oligosaccharide flippase family protein [Flavobacteriales bacterium]MBP8876730.1 oligosaccharide flippase family protein [Flavobacteriales bacterium]MBP9160827.1 oligosaccharide flippase family protein [Flavobacteriales bacterium]